MENYYMINAQYFDRKILTMDDTFFLSVGSKREKM